MLHRSGQHGLGGLALIGIDVLPEMQRDSLTFPG
jgi:hypothetical protein